MDSRGLKPGRAKRWRWISQEQARQLELMPCRFGSPVRRVPSDAGKRSTELLNAIGSELCFAFVGQKEMPLS